MSGVVDVIARSPEAKNNNLTPQQMVELIFAVARGMLMFDILQPPEMTAAERREHQLGVVRNLWRLMFKTESKASYA
jgi:glutamyl-tRNA reductase